MNIFKKRIIVTLALVGLTLIGSAETLRAQELTQIQGISFGAFAILDNSAPRSITVAPNNNVTGDPNIAIATDPTRGEYLLTNQDPSRALDISVSVGSLTLNDSGGHSMTVDTFTDNNPSTDVNGDATVYIGATLTTSGSGTVYNDGSYEDNNMSLIINYQ